MRGFPAWGSMVLALLLLAATQPPKPPDESGLPESERRIPPGDYCKRSDVTITPRETHAHHCSCTFNCIVNEDGTITEQEGPTCMAYCRKNGRRCTCHVEEPCPKPGHNALVDMNGRVVATRRPVRIK